MDEIYALQKGNKAVKLDPIMDIGGSAEYAFLNRLSAFVNANNLLNNKYQRWSGYQVYGMNIFGGIRLKF
jgi:outer membrane receptor protein involved in Fe transport